jgi:hypothetical protein
MTMPQTHVLAVAVLTVLSTVRAAGPTTLYENDFDSAEAGKAPADMLVLDGGFAVREEGGAKFLELPGAPLETFGVLFGPAVTNNVAVSARIQGSRRGRLFPAFGVGLGGVNGYKLRVSPGKKELELHKGDTDLVSVPFEWQSGQWTHFRLRVREAGAGAWKVEGKAWTEGAAEPAAWPIAFDDKETPRAGRAAIWGAPYAGTPIRYDDLRLERVGAEDPKR